ncbi:MAG: undecaprenyldiphospho-muramoylpentapeptide beta-N-acetylglucosaminyltransferase [Anaerovoracaceae bacterium]|jgi:UDP-N-acetylglucosamine--N-acetylmuramyl-(pentapeptide) pyrophosphoryl-undecaprenol N-acetylglucosamine transferase
MRVIMTGGGTGGHIYPAIAIADKIKRKNPHAQILFLGTQRGMEKDLVPKGGYDIKFITVSGFNRKNLLKNFKTLKDLLKGSREARNILKEFMPDVVIGTGGYVCGPVVREAYKMGIPTFIHEQNAIPGMTNKMLEPYVHKIFLSFEEASRFFKDKNKLVVTGNPLRKGFLITSIQDNRVKLGIEPNEFVILCFGGSRGAERINSVVSEAVKTLIKVDGLRIYFITGRVYYDRIVSSINNDGLDGGGRLTILPYADNIQEYLSASDLVISRAGALTVSEITACGKASILIPSPNVTGNHQYYNGKVLEDKGAAVIVLEKDLSAEKLTDLVLKLKNNREGINSMSAASASLGRVDAVDVIYENLTFGTP